MDRVVTQALKTMYRMERIARDGVVRPGRAGRGLGPGSYGEMRRVRRMDNELMDKWEKWKRPGERGSVRVKIYALQALLLARDPETGERMFTRGDAETLLGIKLGTTSAYEQRYGDICHAARNAIADAVVEEFRSAQISTMKLLSGLVPNTVKVLREMIDGEREATNTEVIRAASCVKDFLKVLGGDDPQKVLTPLQEADPEGEAAFERFAEGVSGVDEEEN